MRTLLPDPPSSVSKPGPPLRTSSPAPPSSVSLPSPPLITSAPSPPSARKPIASAGQPAGGDDVVTAEPVDRELILSRVGVGDVDRRAEPGHADLALTATGRDYVTAIGAVDDDLVGRAVVGLAGASAEVGLDLGEIGSRDVVDGQPVRAPEGCQIDLLDARQIHRDRADITGEAHAAAVGRDVELFGGV